MDVQILRSIVQSGSEVMKEVENVEKFNGQLDEKFPPLDRSVLAALTKSFTDLITHKVSTEAYQRYCVRIQVIEVLREWIRPSRELDCSRTFCQSEKVLEFAARIVRIYLTNELLYRDDGNIDVLVTLAKALICLIPKRKIFVKDLERILERIGSLKQTEDSERLLLNVLKEKDSLELSSQTVESLYLVQRVRLIEEPLTENFIVNFRDSVSNNQFKSSCRLDKLLEMSVTSPTIFHISCSVLKEIFVHSDYSSRVMDYINYYLESLKTLCQGINKNILDLYPIRLQALIILLNIVPEQHTYYSRQHAILSLEKIYLSNPEETLILLTHFPEWLKLLSARLKENSRSFIEESSRNEESFSPTSMIVDDE